MEKFTQKYTIVQFLEDIPEGSSFSANNWPLHITLIDVFAIHWDVPTMTEKLTRFTKNQAPIPSTAKSDTMLGPQKQVRVTLLEKTNELIKLHNSLITLFEQGGLKPNNPQFVKTGFLPHATVQKHARLRKGDQVFFNALSLVDFFPNEDPYQRKVLKTTKFPAT